MARVQRFYSILNHKLVTVHCVSNLRLAVDWVNVHPSRLLCDPLKYHPVYTIMRKSGKFLFELGGIEASIVESSLYFGVEGQKAMEFGADQARNVRSRRFEVSDVVSEKSPLLDEIGRLGFTVDYVSGTGYLMIKDESGCVFGGYDLAKGAEVARDHVLKRLVASGRVG